MRFVADKSGLVFAFLGLATMLFMLAACLPEVSATPSVRIFSFKYDPDPITISVGDTITWTNEDTVGHTSTAVDDSFDTGMFFPDESATVTFDIAGCSPTSAVPIPR